jgi:hypothetical protein
VFSLRTQISTLSIKKEFELPLFKYLQLKVQSLNKLRKLIKNHNCIIGKREKNKKEPQLHHSQTNNASYDTKINQIKKNIEKPLT